MGGLWRSGTRPRLTAAWLRAGHTQTSLAREVGCTQKTVSRWETGELTPGPGRREPLARALGLSLAEVDEILVRDEPIAADVSRQEDAYPERHEVEPYAWNLPPLADALGITLAELADLLPRDQEWQADRVDRRTFLTGFGGTLAAVAAALEQTVSLARTDDQRGSALRLLGHAHQAAGQAAFDRLDLDEAEMHLHHALQIGGELGDAEMVANAQTQLGDVARRRRRYPMALRLLEGAERHAGTASLLTRTLHWQTVARAHAEMGARQAFEHAIDQAGEVAAMISPEHHREGDRSPRGILLEKGQGLTLLGDPTAALEIYDQVAPPAFRGERERGSFVIIRAQALAHAGHLDAGVHLAVEGLELARGYDSPRHVSRVQRMYDRLTATWSPSEPALVELHDALVA